MKQYTYKFRGRVLATVDEVADDGRAIIHRGSKARSNGPKSWHDVVVAKHREKQQYLVNSGVLKQDKTGHLLFTEDVEVESLHQAAVILFHGAASKNEKLQLVIDPPIGETDASPHKTEERLIEVYIRDQTLANTLRRMYKGECQICGDAPFQGAFGMLSEAHHIHWLCRGGGDTVDNLVLLCPNHHAAVHAGDPDFDWTALEFRFEHGVLPLVLNTHLQHARIRGSRRS